MTTSTDHSNLFYSVDRFLDACGWEGTGIVLDMGDNKEDVLEFHFNNITKELLQRAQDLQKEHPNGKIYLVDMTLSIKPTPWRVLDPKGTVVFLDDDNDEDEVGTTIFPGR